MKSNLEIINDYYEYKKIIGGYKEITISKNKPVLILFSKDVKDFLKPEEKEIIKHLSKFKRRTRNTRIGILKNFYRWKYKLDKEDKLPDFIKRIKQSKIITDDIEYRERVVSENEYKIMLRYAREPKHRAILETLYYTGVRKGELYSIKSNGVNYDGKYTNITIRKSKTKTRDVIYQGRLEILLEWCETLNPYKDDEKTYLFYGHDSNKKYSDSGLNTIITNICKRAKLRHINVHDFRHTLITNHRAKGTPPAHIETNHGLKPGTRMMAVYSHNKLEDYKKWLEEKEKKTPVSYKDLEVKYKEEKKENKKEIEELKNQNQVIVDVFEDVLDYLSKGDKKIKDKINNAWGLAKKGELKV